jgi:hypothetical protein
MIGFFLSFRIMRRAGQSTQLAMAAKPFACARRRSPGAEAANDIQTSRSVWTAAALAPLL